MKVKFTKTKVTFNDIIFGAALAFFSFTLGKYTERRKQDAIHEGWIRPLSNPIVFKDRDEK